MDEYISEEDQLKELVNRIFPEQRKWEQSQQFRFVSESASRLGIIEEVGELSHAILKMKQGIREPDCFKKNPSLARTMTRNEGFALDMIDAVGDIMIYYISLINHYIHEEDTGYDSWGHLDGINEAYEYIIPEGHEANYGWWDMDKNPHEPLEKIIQCVYEESVSGWIPACLNYICENLIYSFIHDENLRINGAFYCLEKTWDGIVKKRDWQKNNKTGEV